MVHSSDIDAVASGQRRVDEAARKANEANGNLEKRYPPNNPTSEILRNYLSNSGYAIKPPRFAPRCLITTVNIIKDHFTNVMVSEAIPVILEHCRSPQDKLKENRDIIRDEFEKISGGKSRKPRRRSSKKSKSRKSKSWFF